MSAELTRRMLQGLILYIGFVYIVKLNIAIHLYKYISLFIYFITNFSSKKKKKSFSIQFIKDKIESPLPSVENSKSSLIITVYLLG